MYTDSEIIAHLWELTKNYMDSAISDLDEDDVEILNKLKELRKFILEKNNDELNSRLNSLANKIKNYEEYVIYVLKGKEDLYDIFLVPGRFSLEGKYIQRKNIISDVAYNDKEAFTISGLSATKAANFVKALYCYIRFCESQVEKNSSSDGDYIAPIEDLKKDTTTKFLAVSEEDVIKKAEPQNDTEYKDVVNFFGVSMTHIPSEDLTKLVIYSDDLLDFKLADIKRTSQTSFLKYLELIDHNQYYGTKILELKGE